MSLLEQPDTPHLHSPINKSRHFEPLPFSGQGIRHLSSPTFQIADVDGTPSQVPHRPLTLGLRTIRYPENDNSPGKVPQNDSDEHQPGETDIGTVSDHSPANGKTPEANSKEVEEEEEEREEAENIQVEKQSESEDAELDVAGWQQQAAAYIAQLLSDAAEEDDEESEYSLNTPSNNSDDENGEGDEAMYTPTPVPLPASAGTPILKRAQSMAASSGSKSVRFHQSVDDVQLEKRQKWKEQMMQDVQLAMQRMPPGPSSPSHSSKTHHSAAGAGADADAAAPSSPQPEPKSTLPTEEGHPLSSTSPTPRTGMRRPYISRMQQRLEAKEAQEDEAGKTVPSPAAKGNMQQQLQSFYQNVAEQKQKNQSGARETRQDDMADRKISGKKQTAQTAQNAQTEAENERKKDHFHGSSPLPSPVISSQPSPHSHYLERLHSQKRYASHTQSLVGSPAPVHAQNLHSSSHDEYSQAQAHSHANANALSHGYGEDGQAVRDPGQRRLVVGRATPPSSEGSHKTPPPSHPSAPPLSSPTFAAVSQSRPNPATPATPAHTVSHSTAATTTSATTAATATATSAAIDSYAAIFAARRPAVLRDSPATPGRKQQGQHGSSSSSSSSPLLVSPARLVRREKTTTADAFESPTAVRLFAQAGTPRRKNPSPHTSTPHRPIPNPSPTWRPSLHPVKSPYIPSMETFSSRQRAAVTRQAWKDHVREKKDMVDRLPSSSSTPPNHPHQTPLTETATTPRTTSSVRKHSEHASSSPTPTKTPPKTRTPATPATPASSASLKPENENENERKGAAKTPRSRSKSPGPSPSRRESPLVKIPHAVRVIALGSDFVQLVWNEQVPSQYRSTTDKYVVYRSRFSASGERLQGTMIEFAPTSAISIIDTAVEPETTYGYVVITVSASSVHSRPSPVVKITTRQLVHGRIEASD
jgi:hypothetical protein